MFIKKITNKRTEVQSEVSKAAKEKIKCKCKNVFSTIGDRNRWIR